MTTRATRAAIVAVALGVLFLPGKAAQFSLSLIACVILISFAWSRALRRGLSAGRTFAEIKASRHDREELSVFVENRSPFPAFPCRVSDSPGILSIAAEDGRWAIPLAGRERVRLSYGIRCNERGEYEVGPIRVAASDPIGLFPFEKTVDARCSVLVRPRRARLDLVPDSGVPQGSIRARDPRYEDITLYRSVRDYTPGDELRRINWKSSARLGRLFTNEYQNSLNCPFFVFLNLSAADYPLQGRHETAESVIESAASLAARAADLRQRCAFATTGVVAWGKSVAGGNAALESEESGRENAAREILESLSWDAEAFLDLLARVALSDGETTGVADLAERAFRSAAPGSRFFFVSPTPPPQGAFRGRRFARVSEYVHEANV